MVFMVFKKGEKMVTRAECEEANAKKFADKLQKEGKLDVSIWEIPDYREVLPHIMTNMTLL